MKAYYAQRAHKAKANLAMPKNSLTRKITVAIVGIMLAFTGMLLPASAAAAASPNITVTLKNRPANADGKWRFGEKMNFEVKVANGADAIRVEPYTDAQHTNLDKALSGCKWNLSPNQTTNACTGSYTITPKDAGAFIPKVTYKMCAGTSCTNTNVTELPALELDQQQIEPALAVSFNIQNSQDAPWELGDTVRYKVSVTNTSSAARSYEGIESNLAGFNCKWGTINKDQTKTDCPELSHTISAEDVAAKSFTPYVKFKVYGGTSYPKNDYYTLSDDKYAFKGDPIQVGENATPGTDPEARTGVQINAPQSVANSDFSVKIDLVNQPQDGTWDKGDVAEFRITLVNSTDKARGFEIENGGTTTNLTDASGCKWFSANPREPQECYRAGHTKRITHTITAEDVAAGEFTPYARLVMHNATNYSESDIVSYLDAGPVPAPAAFESAISAPKNKYVVGQTIPFTITFKNTSGIARSFASGASNMTNTGGCKWNSAAPNDPLTCTAGYHKVTAADLERGSYTPYIQWKMHDTTGYAGDPIKQPITFGTPIEIVDQTIKITKFAQNPDSVKAKYQDGDVVKFDIELTNSSNEPVSADPDSLQWVRRYADFARKDFDSDNFQQKCAFDAIPAGEKLSCSVEYELTESDVEYGYVTAEVAFVAGKGSENEQEVSAQAYGVPTPGEFEAAKPFAVKDANPTLAATSRSGMEMLAQGAGGENSYAARIPAIAVVSNGDVLASYDYRPCDGGSGCGDSPNANWIVQRRSKDNGVTWGAPTVVAMGKSGDGRYGYSDPSYVVDHETGTIFNFHVYSQDQGFWGGNYTRNADGSVNETNRATMNFGLSVSKDNGYTWEQRVVTAQVLDGKVPPIQSCFATSGAGTQKIQAPHKGRLLQNAACLKNDGSVAAFTLYSDDHGTTWKSGALTDVKPGDLNLKFDENKVVELGNGDLMLNSRTSDGSGKGYRIVAISKDGGETWGEYKVDKNLPDTTNNAQIIRAFPNAKPGTLRSQVLLFSNTHDNGRNKGYVKISYDNGATWQPGSVIRSNGTGYTTMAVQPDGSIGLLLEPSGGGWADIAYMNFNLAWIDPDHDLDSELKAKSGFEEQRATDGLVIADIAAAGFFERNDPALNDRFTATGLPQGLSIDPATGVISGTPAAGNMDEQTFKVQVTLAEAEDGTGYPRTAEASFDLVLAANPNPDTPVTPGAVSNVDSQGATDPDALDPASCTVAPFAQVTLMEGVAYRAEVLDASGAAGETKHIDAAGKVEYGYGQTLRITAVAEDGFVLAPNATATWTWSAPTLAALNCSGTPSDGDKPAQTGESGQPAQAGKRADVKHISDTGSSLGWVVLAALGLIAAGGAAVASRRSWMVA